MELDLIPKELSAPHGEAGNTRMRCMADYEVKREIGEGSFSVVYSATEKADAHRDVAIKMCFKKQILKEKR
ncbi:hypothetical protein OSTOST_16104, partial [Ostertagia ostertagi]